MMQTLKILTDFSSTPGPRYKTEGPFSGEQFREEILYPKILDAIENDLKLVVDLDGVQGYGTSFLEEAFGGLIRNDGLEYDTVMKYIDIISVEEPYLKDDIMEYLQAADNENKE